MSKSNQDAVLSATLALLQKAGQDPANTVLKMLAVPLVQRGFEKEVLTAVLSLTEPHYRSEVLLLLVAHLNGTMQRQAVAALKGLAQEKQSPPRAQAWALRQLDQRQFFQEVEQLIKDLDSNPAGRSISVLLELLPQLGRRQFLQVWDVALRNKSIYVGFLMELARYATPEDREQALDLILSRIEAIEPQYATDFSRERFTDSLVPLAPQSCLDRVAAFAQRLKDGEEQVQVAGLCIAGLVKLDQNSAADELCKWCDERLASRPRLRGLMWQSFLYNLAPDARSPFWERARVALQSSSNSTQGHILAALLPCVQPQDLEAAVSEAMAVSHQEADSLKRAHVWCSILRNTSVEQQEGIAEAVLEIALDSKRLNGGAELHARLYSSVAESSGSPRALESIFSALKEPIGSHKWVLFHWYAAHCLPEVRVREALAWIPTDKDGNYVGALVPLISRLAALGQTHDALTRARVLAASIDYNREHALIGVVPYLPVLERSVILAEVQRVLVEHKKEHPWSQRALVLAKLAYFLEGEEKQRTISDALALARGLTYSHQLTPFLHAAALTLAQLARAARIPLWMKLLHMLGQRPRPMFLAGLSALLPAVYAVGGVNALPQLARAVIEVGEWLP